MMNIEGLDYNTKREKLVLPEYGREIQNMVDYTVALPDKADRQRSAEAIVDIMDRMIPQNHDNIDHIQKLWDHLAIMSDFKLDIDYPVDVSQAKNIMSKPEPMAYPMENIPVRHYGKMLFEIFEKLKTMEPGKERDSLVILAANQMKRNLLQWSHSFANEEKVASDLSKYTDGKVQLDLDSFQFDKSAPRETEKKRKKK